jgi:hypothetical protein
VTAPACLAPLPLEELVAYERGDAAEAEERVEEHWFACARCAAALEAVAALGSEIAALVRSGGATASVPASLVARAEREGVRVRTYRLAPGEVVPCSAAPEDDYVAIRLAGEYGRAERVDVSLEATALAGGERQAQRLEDVPVDRSAGELVLLYPAAFIRGLPRSRVRYEVRGVGAGAASHLLGTYHLDHSPWEESGTVPP